MATNPNDTAHPEIATNGQMHDSGNLYGDTYSYGGLTKREHMAIEFACAIASTLNPETSLTARGATTVVREGLMLADELIKQLNEQK